MSGSVNRRFARWIEREGVDVLLGFSVLMHEKEAFISQSACFVTDWNWDAMMWRASFFFPHKSKIVKIKHQDVAVLPGTLLNSRLTNMTKKIHQERVLTNSQCRWSKCNEQFQTADKEKWQTKQIHSNKSEKKQNKIFVCVILDFSVGFSWRCHFDWLCCSLDWDGYCAFATNKFPWFPTFHFLFEIFRLYMK